MARRCEYVHYQLKNIFNFVKDKNNLLIHNLWTCGDHLKNTMGIRGFNEGLTIDLSNDYKINGEYCFKYTASLNQYQGVAFEPTTLPVNTNKVTVTLTVLNLTGGNMEVRLTENGANKTITVPQSETSQEITIEKDVTTTSIQITFIFRSANITAHIDNMSLTTL